MKAEKIFSNPTGSSETDFEIFNEANDLYFKCALLNNLKKTNPNYSNRDLYRWFMLFHIYRLLKIRFNSPVMATMKITSKKWLYNDVTTFDAERFFGSLYVHEEFNEYIEDGLGEFRGIGVHSWAPITLSWAVHVNNFKKLRFYSKYTYPSWTGRRTRFTKVPVVQSYRIEEVDDSKGIYSRRFDGEEIPFDIHDGPDNSKQSVIILADKKTQTAEIVAFKIRYQITSKENAHDLLKKGLFHQMTKIIQTKTKAGVNKNRLFRGTLRMKILDRDQYSCVLCGRGVEVLKDIGHHLEVDHIIPWSKGGTTSMENGRTTCSECNRSVFHSKQKFFKIKSKRKQEEIKVG